MEQMLATAIAAHPYRNMPGGWASDIENLRVKDAEKFFNQYYVPGQHHDGGCRRRESRAHPQSRRRSISDAFRNVLCPIRS